MHKAQNQHYQGKNPGTAESQRTREDVKYHFHGRSERKFHTKSGQIQGFLAETCMKMQELVRLIPKSRFNRDFKNTQLNTDRQTNYTSLNPL
jgi:hypothetical protein